MGLKFAVGDIHGCADALERMLSRIQAYAAQGTVVFLGDYIDRGPSSCEVLQRLIEGPPSGWTWICLKGNHEDMMVGAYSSPRKRGLWLDNGGVETEMSYSGKVDPEHLSWAADLPLIHCDDHRIFVHAGVSTVMPLDKQSGRDFLWMRIPAGHSEDYWGRHLVHGHTRSEANPRTIGNRTNVDSACVFGGRLSCAVFDDEIPGGPIDFIAVPA